jgi:hypothetical protein
MAISPNATNYPLTPRYPAAVAPKRRGVYEVKDGDSHFPDEHWFAYWDGRKFGFRCMNTPANAEFCRDRPTYLPARASWRGLARKP